MFISIVFLIVALIIIGTSTLGIYLSRKNKALKNYTSKIPTIINFLNLGMFPKIVLSVFGIAIFTSSSI